MNHLAAIHITKAQIGMSEADYRELLRANYGVSSAKDLTATKLAHFRAHMDKLGVAYGLPAPVRKPLAAMPTLTPAQKMVVALWYELRDLGKLEAADFADLRKGLRTFVKRQTGIDQLHWCKPAQTRAVIEALKGWRDRGARPVDKYASAAQTKEATNGKKS